MAHLQQRAQGGVAPHDSRSGLPTRSELVGRLARRSSTSGDDALILLEIDDLEAVHEAYGGRSREGVLHIVGERLRSVVRSDDLVAHCDGANFAVLCSQCGVDEALVVADRIRSAVTEPLTVGSHRLGVSLSIGVANCAHDVPGSCLLERAEAALERAKRQGRNRVELWVPAS